MQKITMEENKTGQLFAGDCDMCEEEYGIPIALQDRHQRWHARVNLLSHLGTIIKGFTLIPPFDPGQPGVLLLIDYRSRRIKELLKMTHDDGTMMKKGARSILPDLAKSSFLTLSYLEGRKYTFGNKFSSRETEGDFIYFNPNQNDEDIRRRQGFRLRMHVVPPTSAENYFQLECKDESIFISTSRVKDHGSSTVVSVNGVPLVRVTDDKTVEGTTTTHEKELTFGDIVSVATIHEKGKNRFSDFIFKGSTVDRTTRSIINRSLTTGNNGMVLYIPAVVQTILEFLSTRAVKDYRLLSHLWNVEGLKVLRPRVRVRVLRLPRSHDYIKATQPLMQLSDFAHSLPNQLNFPHWAITNDMDDGIRPRVDITCRKETMDRKFLDDLTWLFTRMSTPTVKSLTLTLRVTSQATLGMFETLLNGVRNTLTHLELDVDCSLRSLPPQAAPEMMELKCLRTLSLESDDWDLSYTPSTMRPFIVRFILPKMTKISSLQLTNSCVPSDSFAKVVLQEIVQLQSFGNKFASMNHIIIDRVENNESQVLARLRENSLRKLELGEMSPKDEWLRQALERHAESLVEVKILFNMEEFGGDLDLNFPARMTHLRTLSVFFFLDKWSQEVGRARLRFGPRQLDDEGEDEDGVDYRRRFPCLETLTVWPVDRDADGFTPLSQVDGRKSMERTSWRLFLPLLTPWLRAAVDEEEDGQLLPATNVTLLDIPFTLKGRYQDVLDDLERVFPNAVFPPELTRARLRARWLAGVAYHSPVTSEEEEEEEDGNISSTDSHDQEIDAGTSEDDLF